LRKDHTTYMARCLQLAQNGLGTTYPNPLVGSVIVHNDQIIGEGWHYQAGSAHAEVNAINAVADQSVLSEATIYVSLEPCSHFGKTPPCADLIIARGIKHVVIGTTDPNPQVAGKGIQKLIAAGCDVRLGILEDACRELNKRFFTFQQKKRPYIFLKWAQTQNGFIAPAERDNTAPVWITSETTRQQVHKMRAEEQAILVGTHTVLADNPSLTTRDWAGNSPLRVVLDRTLKIPKDAHVYNKAAKTIIITERVKASERNIQFETIDFQKQVAAQIIALLYQQNIQSLIIEGGTTTLQTFIDANLWDEAFVYEGNTTFKDGIAAPTFQGMLTTTKKYKTDTLTTYKNTSL